jgi:hypothetical protein
LINIGEESDRAMNSIDGLPAVKSKLVLKMASGKILHLKTKHIPQLSPKASQIAKLIADVINADPHHQDGFAWANRPQEWWSAKLGFSVETFRRLISKPPFVRERIIDPSTAKQVTLVRVGKPGQKTKKHLQNIMSAIWRKQMECNLPSKCFGHLAGLVDHWGHDRAVDIFKLVMNDWSRFMAGVHMEIALLGDEGKKRYYRYPATSVILRFWSVGVEMYVMDQQAKAAKDAEYGAPVPF